MNFANGWVLTIKTNGIFTNQKQSRIASEIQTRIVQWRIFLENWKNVDDEKITFIHRLIWLDLGQSREDPCQIIDRIGYQKKHWIFPASNIQSNRWERHKFNNMNDIVALHSQSESRSLVESDTFGTRNFFYTWWSGLSNWQIVKKNIDKITLMQKRQKKGKRKKKKKKK